MLKLPFKEWFVFAGMGFALAICLQLLATTPVLPATVQASYLEQSVPVEQPDREPDQGAIATAPQAPKLVSAVLGGKPVYVLYATRADDTILVRCYPTYQPVLEVKPMTGQPGVKEGKLTCKAGGEM